MFAIGKHESQADVFYRPDDFSAGDCEYGAMRYFNNLKNLRQSRKLTQQKLADMAGLSKGFISSLENGNKKLIQGTIDSLTAALNCSAGELLDPIDEGANGGAATPFRDHTKNSDVVINLTKIRVIGKLGAASDWSEWEGSSVSVEETGAYVAVEVAADGHGYKPGQIVIADPNAEQRAGDEILVLRERGDLFRYELMIADEVKDGLAVSYKMRDGTPFEPRAGETPVNKGCVMGSFDKRAMR